MAGSCESAAPDDILHFVLTKIEVQWMEYLIVYLAKEGFVGS